MFFFSQVSLTRIFFSTEVSLNVSIAQHRKYKIYLLINMQYRNTLTLLRRSAAHEFRLGWSRSFLINITLIIKLWESLTHVIKTITNSCRKANLSIDNQNILTITPFWFLRSNVISNVFWNSLLSRLIFSTYYVLMNSAYRFILRK
jgi:hypothetical protein